MIALKLYNYFLLMMFVFLMFYCNLDLILFLTYTNNHFKSLLFSVSNMLSSSYVKSFMFPPLIFTCPSESNLAFLIGVE